MYIPYHTDNQGIYAKLQSYKVTTTNYKNKIINILIMFKKIIRDGVFVNLYLLVLRQGKQPKNKY